MAASLILAPLCFEGDMAKNWKKYKRNFNTFIQAYHSDKQPENQIAVLLHSGGEELMDIFDSLGLNDQEKKDLAVVLQKLDNYFIPKTNVTYERFVFFTRKQQNGESYEQYMSILRNLSQSCDFGTLKDSLVKDIFVVGITDKALQEKLLNTATLDINSALNVCRARAVVVQQVEQIQAPVVMVKKEPCIDAIHSPRTQISRPPRLGKSEGSWKASKDKNLKNPVKNCTYCGFDHDYGHCPAFGKQCSKCKKMNHHAKVCKSRRQVDQLMEQDSDSDFDVLNELTLDSLDASCNFWYMVTLGMSDLQVQCKVDTGAASNVLSMDQFRRLGMKNSQLKKTQIILRSFTKNEVPIVGKVNVPCSYKNAIHNIEFMVVNMKCNNILGLETSERLGLISRVDSLSLSQRHVVPDEFVHLFDGTVGCMPHTVKIEVDPSVRPVVCPLRRIPHALLPRVKAELDKMEATGIIRKVEKPTDWVHQLVVVMKKDGSLRICLDPRNLNKAIKRAHYPFPTFDEISALLKGAKFFCKLDAQSGFWMLPMDRESSELCTFQTAWGRYSFLRLPFGLNSSSEIFHSIIARTFQDINNVCSFQDDILLWGDTIQQVKDTLISVLKCADRNGIKFNPNKCVFYAREIEFLGHSFSQNGVSISKDKVKAIMGLKSPTDKKSLQRILGMFNYLSKFISDYSKLTQPLRELLKDDAVFLWDKLHENALSQLKMAVTKAPVLGFFDPSKELTLTVDASSYGLGASLLQEGRPLGFASRALTEAQTRWSQIEKELLAVCFGAERFKQYILGNNLVKTETDHKPLIGLSDKPLHKVSARLQSMLLRLLPYNLKLTYTPGKFMYLADTLSRDFSLDSCDNVDDCDVDPKDLFISVLIEELPLIKSHWDLFVMHTRNDSQLSKLRMCILEGWPNNYRDVDDDCKPYYDFRNELTVVRELIFKGNRLLVPNTLKREMLIKLHTGHPGINRMTSRAEDILFWIGIGQDIKKFVSSCKTCQKFQKNKIKMVMQSRELPPYPWMEVAGDVFQINQKNYLVLVDTLTNFCEVVTLPDLRSCTVIEKMKGIFARHGIPVTFFSDGALYFDSQLFRVFSEEWCFNHVTSSPNFPQSNGHAEVTVKAVKTLFLKAIDSGDDPFLALLNYRNTNRGKIHSPASNLMGRQLRSNIPCSFKSLKPKITILEDRKLIQQSRDEAKQYFDKTARDRTPFSVGQSVSFQKTPGSTWQPGKIEKVADEPRSYMVAGEQGGVYRRNEIHISPRPIASTSKTNGNTYPTQSLSSTVKADSLFGTQQDCETRANHPNPTPEARMDTPKSAAILDSPRKTRAGRAIKLPSRFKDFDMGKAIKGKVEDG